MYIANTVFVPRIRWHLTTCGTAVWLFSRMAPLVLEKFSLCVEGFPTLVTGETLICGMCPLMLLEIAHVVKS